MSPDRIRQLLQARPFVPFTLVMETGRAVEVHDPSHVLIPPGHGPRSIHVAQPEGYVFIVSSSSVVAVRGHHVPAE